MATHRRAKTPVRTAIALTATGAAATGVGLTAPVGHAASVADVQAQVKALDMQAEAATNDYDAAMEQMAGLQKQLGQIQAETTTAQASMNQLLATLGPQAAAAYRSGSRCLRSPGAPGPRLRSRNPKSACGTSGAGSATPATTARA